ncbi:hypothetical protein Y032_1264g3789 [Ancylostoma ceylanicum]|nr:hypothetical protein Y032_1264g3789 [Ancylostoma ceylanicum]
MSFAVFDILYAMADTIVKPLMFLHGDSFIVFSSGVLHGRTTIGSEACCAICALFCASVAFLGLHFIYRYIVVCQSYKLYLFTWPYSTIWIAFVAFFTAYWGLVCYFLLCPDRSFREYIRGSFAAAFEDDTLNVGFIGALYYTVQNSTTVVNWGYCAGIANLLLIQFTTFSIIIYCGPHIYFNLTKVTLSARTRNLQIQLFRALVAQTLLPLFLCYIPCTMIFLVPLSGLQLGLQVLL